MEATSRPTEAGEEPKKYRRYGERFIGGVVNPGARAATIKLVPR
jgi:hypothetical protein